MMNFLTKSLAIEIYNFAKNIKIKAFSKSAFVQTRNKIKPEVFQRLSEVLITEFYTDNEASVKLWKGLRLLAVDGSRLTIPDTKELRSFYGVSKNQTKTSVPQARISVLYDVLNNYIIDGEIAPLKVGEKTLALNHLTHTKTKDLVIYDRGYPSFELIHTHLESGIDCLIRAKKDFSNITKKFISSGKFSKIVELKPTKNASLKDKNYTKDTTIKVRLVRVELADGTIELLMTTLLCIKKYPTNIFKDLYFKRWGVENYYDEIKNKIKIENFSGYSNQSILQDFFAMLFVSNIQTLVVSDINEELQENQTTKYTYKVNTNLSYGFLKDRVVELFLSRVDTEELMLELKEIFRSHLVPIRPNRSFKRNTEKFRKRKKPKVTKNQKDAF